MANGIIGFTESGKAAISYEGRTFYTADKSVIAMAARGNVSGAAKRWAGKTSTARALRQANRAAAKPLYKNVGESLYKKMFKEPKKDRLGTSAAERRQFVEKYRETTKEVGRYIDKAVADKIDIADKLDRLPKDLQERIKKTITEEVEKSYAAKGAVDDSDIENIYDRVTIEMNDYLIETGSDIDPAVASDIMDYIGSSEYLDFESLEGY